MWFSFDPSSPANRDKKPIKKENKYDHLDDDGNSFIDRMAPVAGWLLVIITLTMGFFG